MRAFLLICLISLAGTGICNAQCTPISSLNYNGWEPTDLPPAYADSAYDEYISFKIPKDTDVVYGGFPVSITIDSAVVESISGLPTGFSYSCGPSNPQNNRCSYNGGDKGCIRVYGLPDSNQIGDYNVDLKVTTYIYGQPGRTDSRIFKLKINYPLGIHKSYLGNIHLNMPYPQPASEKVTLPLTLDNKGSLDLKLISLDGKEVFSRRNEAGAGFQNYELPLSGITPGIYFVEIQQGNDVLRTKLQVQ